MIFLPAFDHYHPFVNPSDTALGSVADNCAGCWGPQFPLLS
jgi:hypothetical protein